MSFSDFLFSLAIGFFLFVVYTAELFRAGAKYAVTGPARVRIPVSEPRSSDYIGDKRTLGNRWNMR